MELIDISRDILKTLPYPGDPETRVDRVESMSAGGHCDVTAVYTCLHTATHVDAPSHFLEGGDSVDALPTELFVGECTVIEAPPGPISGAWAEEHFPQRCERLLIKGGGLAYLMESSAYILQDIGCRLFGTDSASVGVHGSNGPVHRALFTSGVTILEGLDLTDAAPGRYFLLAQPLKIGGVEAAPCRALLVKDHLFWTGSR